jgi:hypothetical protein
MMMNAQLLNPTLTLLTHGTNPDFVNLSAHTHTPPHPHPPGL